MTTDQVEDVQSLLVVGVEEDVLEEVVGELSFVEQFLGVVSQESFQGPEDAWFDCEGIQICYLFIFKDMAWLRWRRFTLMGFVKRSAMFGFGGQQILQILFLFI